MARAVERAAPIGVKPEEQVAMVVMYILKTQVTNLLRLRETVHEGLPVETDLCELITIEGRDYLVIGAQTLFARIKRWYMDERHGVKLNQRSVGDYLEIVPGRLQFDRVSGKLEGVFGQNNKRRSKYAVPVDFVQQYETA